MFLLHNQSMGEVILKEELGLLSTFVDADVFHNFSCGRRRRSETTGRFRKARVSRGQGEIRLLREGKGRGQVAHAHVHAHVVHLGRQIAHEMRRRKRNGVREGIQSTI